MGTCMRELFRRDLPLRDEPLPSPFDDPPLTVLDRLVPAAAVLAGVCTLLIIFLGQW